MRRTSVNRYLKDKAMDRIDHALGRPVDPLNHSQTYRDHYAVSSDADKTVFRSSPHWLEGRTSRCGMTWFHVNDAGRMALADHLKNVGDPHRLYEVSYTIRGYPPSRTLIAAKSRSAAKYSHWIDISDALPDLTFGDYCRCATARLA
jgi:hypothetical protein